VEALMPIPLIPAVVVSVKGLAATGAAHALSTASNVKTIRDIVIADPVRHRIVQRDIVLAHEDEPEWFVRHLVKVGFTAKGGETEWIWVKVRYYSKRSKVFTGRVVDRPVLVPMKRGTMVLFELGQVVDAKREREKR
jgi:hypothetical protein